AMILTTVGLGSFRGFIANLLFLRSNRLQEERRYYEVHQLAKWIRNLQPRYTKAIAFMAWNMSYNISVTFDTPEERWVWVHKGIELYLDALGNHSGDPSLYWEYGWIFQHKMGMNLDDANRYYKQQWALQMVKLLGAPSKLVEIASSSGNSKLLHVKLTGLGFKEWTQLLDALKLPYEDLCKEVLASEEHKLPERLTKYLKKEEWQQEVVKFITQSEYKRFDKETLAFYLEGFIDFEKILAQTPQSWSFKEFEKRFREVGRVPRDLTDLLVFSPTDKEFLVDIIDYFMRDRWAHKVYKLDTQRMVAINEDLGKLDWRVPETHAIYWAKLGLEHEPGNIACTRMVNQALKDVVDRGKLLYFSGETHTTIDWTYNIALVDRASETLEKTIASLDENSRTTFESGYQNFLIDAVVALYVYGDKIKAKKYFKKLRDRYPENKKYRSKLEAFVVPELNEDLSSMNEDQCRRIFEGFMRSSFRHVLFREEELAKFWWIRARKLYKSYAKSTANRKGRQGWTRTFKVMTTEVYQLYLQQFPQSSLALRTFNDRMMGPSAPLMLKRPEE
ncbi:MAG: hypothetical protein HRT88_04505, partial [Lentisphaeraceae bacterium]|nr:hypothetical protein [Lentisphaeraceae bacterium]